jgi:ATP-binding cassette subfamily B protein
MDSAMEVGPGPRDPAARPFHPTTPPRAVDSVGSAASPSPRVAAMLAAARHYGISLDPAEFPAALDDAAPPEAAALSAWAQAGGLWARAVRMTWPSLLKLDGSGPIVLLLKDGAAAILAGVNTEQKVVFLRDPLAPSGQGPAAVDEFRLARVWSGEAILLRAERSARDDAAPFSLGWLAGLVWREHHALRDICIASLTLSCLTIFPPLLVMTVVDKVLTHQSHSTLLLLVVILGIAMIYEMLLGHARRIIVVVLGTRLDTRLNLHVFSRLLRLPLDYFERHPAGETMYKVGSVYKVREFLTGKLLTTLLDTMTLVVLLPFLFYLNATLAWIVLVCAVIVMAIIAVFLRPMRRAFAKVVKAETDRSSALGETIFGMKTVKALALEPQRKSLWDDRVAASAAARLAFGRLSNWPQSLVAPFERFMSTGIVLVGAYFALTDSAGYAVGALFAFMMLSARAAQPLVGLARLLEDYEEIGAAVGQAASVLNRAMEPDGAMGGLRPEFEGGIAAEELTFTYEGTETPALQDLSFAITPGTMLGVVGRSGSGKSTLIRLLQGINRDYRGSLKVDGTDLREINLRHLRTGFGVVLQENFLFRGTVRDNITAGRAGLTLEDAVRAARLAGAEEFIERLPHGYETIIEEGSPNLSGGQRQRLAIARALITDPRILILDEATSALDPESEALINANLLRIARGRTMIIVSHRLSSLTDCHQILVLEKGRLVDIGPHKELLQRCGTYRQLWAQQNRHIDGQGLGAGMGPGLRHPSLATARVPGE